VPHACPSCKAEDKFAACGPGVERVAEEVRAMLPQARVGVMTSDETGIRGQDSGFRKDALPESRILNPESLIHAMTCGDIDILIGTQMIAKGHHFANLALVGVVDADMGLNGGDLRAGERTYQLLHQLSGRAGREQTPGVVLLQTYQPEHPVMRALQGGDRDGFMQAEAEMREDALMPPFGKLAAIIIEGRDERQVVEFARQLVRDSGFRIQDSGKEKPESRILNPDPLILGPAPAPLARLRGRFRYRILVKAKREFALQDWLAYWLHARKVPAALKVKIDVDPYSFV
jgi:primosomal protein N' (replication factor Y)